MNERDWLVERFEENRSHLRAVAYRTLGSLSKSAAAGGARSGKPATAKKRRAKATGKATKSGRRASAS